MNRLAHRMSISFYALVVIAAIVALSYLGFSFYNLPIEERFFDKSYELLKPSGVLGHGLGIIGTLFILIGLITYMIRKRVKAFFRLGLLKHWLEFHIFMCTLGPILILFHTTFKFGGIVSIGFWSMVVVVASGVVGRFIYLQIPHSLEGRELNLKEIQDLKNELDTDISDKYKIDVSEAVNLKGFKLNEFLKKNEISEKEFIKVKRLIKKEKKLNAEIRQLDRMHNIFKYWHVAHMPFALIMLIILVIHVSVVLTFGYKWIF